MNIKININDSVKKMELIFDIKPTKNKPKFNPTTDNKIHIEVEDDDEDRYWYFL
jgi:hypothetical protein